MAFKLAVKLPFLGGAKKAPSSKPSAAAAPAKGKPLPLIGRMSTGRQLQVLTGLLVVFLVVDAAIVAYDTKQRTIATVYIATAGKLRMLSQRLAKAAQQASQGNREAFKQLRESREEFGALIKVLLSGGTEGGVQVPPTSGSARPALEGLDREWAKTDRNAALVAGEERNLVALGGAVRSINNGNPTLAELTDEISALSVQSGGSARQNAVTSELAMLTQRMAKNANTMLAEEIVDPEVAFLLGKDSNTYRGILQGLLQGSEVLRIVRVGDAQLRGKVGELESAFKDYQRAVTDILGNQQRLVNAKRAARDIFNDSEALLKGTEQLNSGYEGQVGGRDVDFIALGVVSALALVLLILIGRVYIDDGRRRAEESERQNKTNQEAILRLLDEEANHQ